MAAKSGAAVPAPAWARALTKGGAGGTGGGGGGGGGGKGGGGGGDSHIALKRHLSHGHTGISTTPPTPTGRQSLEHASTSSIRSGSGSAGPSPKAAGGDGDGDGDGSGDGSNASHQPGVTSNTRSPRQTSSTALGTLLA